jgi:hypothetical protein
LEHHFAPERERTPGTKSNSIFQEISPMQSEATNTLLPLDLPRVIPIIEGKHIYTFYFRRITQGDYEKYFSNIYFAQRNDGSDRINIQDLNTAAVTLFEETVDRVEGYAGDFTTRPGWQAKIPPSHSLKVGWKLVEVAAVPLDDERPIDPDRMEVALDAVWSRTEAGNQVTMFKGLKHFFSPPSLEDKRRFYRAGSMSKIVGGNRKGTTVNATRHALLIELYDKLIISVDGYSVAGKTVEKDQIKSWMDAVHKVYAVQELFAGNEVAVEEPVEQK